MYTLQQAVHHFLLLDRAPQTQRTYKRVLGEMAAALGPLRDLSLVSDADLLDYIYKLRVDRALKTSSLSLYVRIIHAFFAFCLKRQWITTSPAQGIFIAEKPLDPERSRAIPPAVLSAMVDASRYHARNLAILLFLADTGCRVGGIGSLTLDRLDVENRTAVLHEKGDKWVRVYFGERTAAALRDWLAKRPATMHTSLFTSGAGRPFVADGISALVRRLSTLVTGGRAYGPHSIRHAVGHALAKRGVPVTITARKLGHANYLMTMRRYYPEDDGYVRAISESLSLAALTEAEPPRLTPDNPKIVRFNRSG
jgi:integrase